MVGTPTSAIATPTSALTTPQGPGKFILYFDKFLNHFVNSLVNFSILMHISPIPLATLLWVDKYAPLHLHLEDIIGQKGKRSNANELLQ